MSERAVSVTAAEAEALRGWVARTTNLGWKVEEVSAPDDLHQWAVLRTPEAPPERSFDHFVDF